VHSVLKLERVEVAEKTPLAAAQGGATLKVEPAELVGDQGRFPILFLVRRPDLSLIVRR